MKHIHMFQKTGRFAENKDIARDVRVKELLPALQKGERVTMDFKGVDAATQSFVHALLSDAVRKFGAEAFERITFKGCNENVQRMINIVADYMQEGLGEG